jgi:hypothetical protein
VGSRISAIDHLNIIDGEYFHLLKEADSTYLRNIQSEGRPLWPASETKPNLAETGG